MLEANEIQALLAIVSRAQANGIDEARTICILDNKLRQLLAPAPAADEVADDSE
jgi:hypothetical protein